MTLHRAIYYLITLLFCVPIGTFAQKKPELFALTVGIEKYKKTEYNLRFAAADAKDVAAALRQQTALWNIKTTTTLTDAKASGNAIIEAIKSFQKKVTADDFFVFMFSGHGADGRLVPYDFDGNTYRSTLSKEELFAALDDLGCGYIVFIDACYSGSFAKDTGGKDLGVEQQHPAIEKASKDLVDALSGTDKPYLVFGSSATNQKSWECASCGHGYFAQAILWALANKPVQDGKDKLVPDADNDGLLSVSEFDQFLKEAVRAMTSGERNPQKVYSRITMGQGFYLAAFDQKKKQDKKEPEKPSTTANIVPKIMERCAASNKKYRLGCDLVSQYLECSGALMTPTDFCALPQKPGSEKMGSTDFYRSLLVRYQVPRESDVVALVQIANNDYLIFGKTGFYTTMSRRRKVDWVPETGFMSYEELAQYRLESDNLYLNFIGGKKGKTMRQILVKPGNDSRGLRPRELGELLGEIGW